MQEASFTCYFPKGTSAATVAAAPVSKSDVARALLQAASQQSGISAAQVAKQQGVSQATMSYHAKRLEAAGLLQRQRAGTRIQLFATAGEPGREETSTPA